MIAGIDYSTKAVDVVLLADEGNEASWHRFALDQKRRTTWDRVRDVRLQMPTPSWWEDENVWLVGIEQPMSRFPHVAKALGIVAASLLSRLPAGMCVIETQPKEWKSVFVGDTEATKQSVAAHMIDRIGLQRLADEGWDDNACDAYGIAMAVRELNERAIERSALMQIGSSASAMEGGELIKTSGR